LEIFPGVDGTNKITEKAAITQDSAFPIY